MRKLFLLCPLAAVCVALPAQAETTPLPTLLVTPARVEQPLAQVNAAVTIIQRADIEQSGARTLDELLLGVPGVAIANAGGLGKQTGLFLRGSESNHTLVLIDGVRINTAKDGAALLQNIPTSQIDRVEVVRGPRSSLYGSDALGGVIQVFTRKADKTFSGVSEATVGNRGTLQLSQFLGGQLDGTQWDLNISDFSSNGEDAQQSIEPDKDGYENRSISAGLRQQVGDQLSLGARIYRAEGDLEFDSSFPMGTDHRTAFIQQTLSGTADYLLTENTNIKAQLSRAEERTKDFTDGTTDGSAIGTRDTYSLQVDHTLADEQIITLGLEQAYDAVDGPSLDFARDQRRNSAVFTQWLGSRDALNYQLSLRFDNNQQFGSQTTGNATFGYAVNPWFNPYASYGTAFVTPTFVDLFYPGFGNPGLRPEKGRSFELGSKGGRDGWHYNLSAFASRTDNLIIFSGTSFLPENINQAHMRGFEVSLSKAWQHWWFELAGSFTRALDDDTDLQLIRRPKWNGRASLRYSEDTWQLRTDLRSQGASWDNNFNNFPAERVRLGGFMLVDISTTRQLYKGLEIEGKVSNLFDRDAVTVFDFNNRGRLALATLRYRY